LGRLIAFVITEAQWRLYLLWALAFVASSLAIWNETPKWKGRGRLERILVGLALCFGFFGSIGGAAWTVNSQQRQVNENETRFVSTGNMISAVARKNGVRLLDATDEQKRIGGALLPYDQLRVYIVSTPDSAILCRNVITAFRDFGRFSNDNIVDRCAIQPGGAFLDWTPSSIAHQIQVDAAMEDADEAASVLISALRHENLDAGPPPHTPSPQEQETYQSASSGQPDRRSLEIQIFSP
jgi:hypothetical protein